MLWEFSKKANITKNVFLQDKKNDALHDNKCNEDDGFFDREELDGSTPVTPGIYYPKKSKSYYKFCI